MFAVQCETAGRESGRSSSGRWRPGPDEQPVIGRRAEVSILGYLVMGCVMLLFSILAFGPYLLGMMDHDDPYQKERRHED